MTAVLEQLAMLAGEKLKSQDYRLVTAESCTGGGLAYWITSIPGSSDWFDRGFVTYSNTSKQEILGVKPKTLREFGAVSKQTVCEMAEGALRAASRANLSIAITGIAGPDGGSEKKPIGTIWMAYSHNNKTISDQYYFSGTRLQIRELTIRAALELILESID